jgi:hypothetical protein
LDQHRSRLQHQGLLDCLAEATGGRSHGAADFNQANTAVWRYLRWHRVRLSGQDENRKSRPFSGRGATSAGQPRRAASQSYGARSAGPQLSPAARSRRR